MKEFNGAALPAQQEEKYLENPKNNFYVEDLDLKTGHYSIVIVFWNFDGIDKHTNKSLVSFGISFDSKTKIFVKMISRKKTSIYF